MPCRLAINTVPCQLMRAPVGVLRVSDKHGNLFMRNLSVYRLFLEPIVVLGGLEVRDCGRPASKMIWRKTYPLLDDLACLYGVEQHRRDWHGQIHVRKRRMAAQGKLCA